MALAAGIVWECRGSATAGNVNGGGFKAGASGTDWSKQDAAQYALTGGTSAGAGALFLHASASADMIGNLIHIISGTNFTAGWYEITGVSAGVSITTDRNCTSGVGAVGVANIGGAISLGSAGITDNTWIQVPVAGNTIYVKGGTAFAPANMSSAPNNGTNLLPIKVIGYTTTRGDNPVVAANQPSMVFASNAGLVLGSFWELSYLNMSVSSALGISLVSDCKIKYCKVINTSVTANRAAVSFAATAAASAVYNCEIISLRGNGVNNATTGNAVTVMNCYIHDSDVGIKTSSTTGTCYLGNNIIASCVTAAINFANGFTTPQFIFNNTLYGTEDKLGTGILFTSAGNVQPRVFNNIMYGFATGISAGDSLVAGPLIETNNYFNNTADATNWTKAASDIALNPNFTTVAQITGTAGTTAAGILTDNAVDFSSVVGGRDYLYVVSGTGVVAGVYAIASATLHTVTTSPALANDLTADKVYKITTGRNFTLATPFNMRGAGTPGVFLGGTGNQGYTDVGAVSIISQFSTDPGQTNVKRGVTYTANDVSKLGSLSTGGGANGFGKSFG